MAYLRVGELRKNNVFGTQVPGCEPYWYLGYYSPYYKETHLHFRATVRAFVEEHIKPNVDDWVEQGSYPQELHRMAYRAGIQGALFPAEYGGTPPEDYDSFHELILWDELARAGGGRNRAPSRRNTWRVGGPPPPVGRHRRRGPSPRPRPRPWPSRATSRSTRS